MIPYGTQNITDEDINAVVETLRSDFITQGPKVSAFEEAIANYTQVTYAVATNSATSALHVACLALGLSPGDKLWTTPNSFVASANCGIYCGADVDFVDIELTHYNLCPKALEEKLIHAKKQDMLPKVLVIVDFAGQPCDLQAIKKLADAYHFKIIEDASHAIGSTYKGFKTGSNQYSDITIFSFHPVKIITSGEGGCATTNDPKIAESMRQLVSHGITRNDLLMETNDGPWFYEQHNLGFNYRMTDIHAALGLSQLNRIESFITKRHQIADCYEQRLRDLPLQLPSRNNHSQSALHLYPVVLLDHDPALRLSTFSALRDKSIGVNVHYIPIHLQPFYKNLGFKPGDYPNAESYYARTITIPLHPKLTNENIDYISDSLHELLV